MDRWAISRDTLLCMSLAGRPGHFGTRFQNHLYAALGLDYVYKAFTTTDLRAAIGGIRALGIRGCAISMPFKEACIALLDSLDPSAASIDAVNTIVNDDGHLRGYNTDYVAVRSLVERHGVDRATPFVLRGSGGMAKAVAAALHDHGFREGMIVARNPDAGRALAASHGFGFARDMEGVHARGAMLINVTPLGMVEGPDANARAFTAAEIEAASVVFDVVARPAETPLVRAARAAGRHVITGGEVLVLQGVEQFELYTGLRPDDEAIAAAAAFALAP